MHVLITGGAGFIGSNLALYHLKKGDKVQVVDNLSTGSIKNLEECFSYHDFIFDEVNILTDDQLDNKVNWADRIYHLAAVVGVFRVLEEPISVLSTNIAGCERLLRAVQRSEWKAKVIIASTSEVYGNREGNQELSEDMELIISPGMNSRWNYSISKLADEAFGISYAREHDLDITVIRFFNVIGPNQTGKYGMVVPRFVKQAVKNEDITIFGDGSQVRSFTDIRDVIIYLNDIAEEPTAKGEIINIGSHQEITIKALAEKVKELAGSESKFVYIPYEKAYGEEFEEIYHRKPNLTKLKRFSTHRLEWTLDETIMDLIERLRKDN
jgi:UDP-glucose 4-epimerase